MHTHRNLQFITTDTSFLLQNKLKLQMLKDLHNNDLLIEICFH